MSTSSNSDVEQDTPLGLIVQEVWIQLCHLKARHSGADSNENLKFMEWICFEDMENGTRLLVMMKRTEMKISEKIPFVTFSQFENLIIDGQAILVDEDGNPLKKVEYPGDHDSEDEVASVDNDSGVCVQNAVE
ncbi:hypothetical protein Tco_0454700 [Tanacetum coccineum]